MLTEEDIEVGDIVQVVIGAQDLSNGLHAYVGSSYYYEGHSMWGVVHSITQNYNSVYRSSPVTAVLIYGPRDNPTTPVWRVEPKDIAENIIKKNPKPQEEEPPPEPEPEPEPEPPEPPPDLDINRFVHDSNNSDPFATKKGQEHWGSGLSTKDLDQNKDTIGSIGGATGHEVHDLEFAKTPISELWGTWRKLTPEEKRVTGSMDIEVDESVTYDNRVKFTTAWESNYELMLNDFKRDAEGKQIGLINNIQNELSFPAQLEMSNRETQKEAMYDYQIIPGDTRYNYKEDGKVKPGIPVTLESKMMEVRSSFGIPVHGNNMLARAMKYYMYNRFKSPDTNLLHNKSVTYVFFTRPDLNLLNTQSMIANSQTLNHTETAMIWRRYPELFKLLTSCSRCKDDNDFNMLLSNQVTSFDIKDEEIDVIEAGKSWGEYTMLYGESYTGRNAGEFSCNFNETSDYSIINLMKLWVTYIDNVSRGAWSPSYNLSVGEGLATGGISDSHVYTKTLDYAASCYVFKCGPDGEDVLYWSKYYGVYPVNTGSSALTWDNDQPIGQTPKLNIRFKYAWKKDLSPISLVEFNDIAKVSNGEYLPSFDVAHNNSYRPFVGAPFIELTLRKPGLEKGTVKIDQALTQIKLKFKKYPVSTPEKQVTGSEWFVDKNLYMAPSANGQVDTQTSSNSK